MVIIVDEIAKAEAKLNEIYGNIDEACSVLKEAVLDEKSIPFDFNTALLISSLSLEPLGYPTSNLPIESLRIPASLNPRRIVTEWWKCKEEDMRVLYMLQLVLIHYQELSK